MNLDREGGFIPHAPEPVSLARADRQFWFGVTSEFPAILELWSTTPDAPLLATNLSAREAAALVELGGKAFTLGPSHWVVRGVRPLPAGDRGSVE